MNVTTEGSKLNRRAFLATAAVAPIAGMAATETENPLIGVIEALEDHQGWEPASVLAAKAYAAHMIRDAMGLPPGDTKYAEWHVEFQQGAWEQHKKSHTYATNKIKGIIPRGPWEATLA